MTATIRNSLVFLGIWLSVILVPAVGATFDPELICTLLIEGTKINDPRDCVSWIQCIDGKPVSGSCEEGFYYERASESCVISDNVKCISSDPCAAEPNGFPVDPYSCNGYYYCKNGVGVRGECKEGWNYNPGTESCIRDFACIQKMNPDSYCNILPDGVFIKDNTNCNGYQMCWKGDVITGTCSDTFFFSANQGKCDYPENVECAFTEPPPIVAEPEDCAQADTFISDKKSCNGYYYCRENQDNQMILEHGKCADNHFFHDGVCVSRTKIACVYDRCVDLGYTKIELINVSNDGCTGFAICQDGISIGQGVCPTGQYFDELTQRCSTQAISYTACALSTDN